MDVPTRQPAPDRQPLDVGGPRRSAATCPTSLRIAGGIMIVLGVLNIATYFLTPDGASMDVSTADIVWNVVSTLVLVLGGVGLLAKVRWGWPLAFLVAVVAIVAGVYMLVQPGDITDPGAGIVALVVLVVPGGLLLAALVRPAARAWLRVGVRRDS